MRFGPVTLGLAIAASGCADLPYPVRPLTIRTTQTQGGALALARDHTIAVAVNRAAESVRVFRVSLDESLTAAPVATLPTPGEPWAAVIGGDDDTAYVILRRSREVVEITGLRTRPTLGRCAPTGSEPTGVAISPRGGRLYVSNWAEGTVTEVLTASMTVARTIDLNASLVGSGMLGDASRIGASPGPGFAHPRAVVVTNDGDTSDGDETVYVTEFFSQAPTGDLPAGDARLDLGRQGVVYRFNVGSGRVGPPIPIAPVPDTGFRDAEGNATGCFPNQLYAAALDNGRLYVTSVCESPRGPIGPVVDPATGALADDRNFKTLLHAAVFVIDTGLNRELTGERLVLTDRFRRMYDGVEPVGPRTDEARRRMPLIPNDIAFVPDPERHVAYVSSYGSDAVFRIAFTTSGAFERVGSVPANFVKLDRDDNLASGHLPIGVAVASRERMLVLNESSRDLQLVDLNAQEVRRTEPSADAPPDTTVRDGRRRFVTGLGRWSYRGQAWSSCESCHPDGLTDNVTWSFARGPRQTISLDGTYGPMGRSQRILNWTASADEVHDFEATVRDLSGGVGAIVHRRDDSAREPAVANADRIHFDGTSPVPTGTMPTDTPQSGLDGSTGSLMPSPAQNPRLRSALDDWERIDQYVRSIRAPNAPVGLSATDVRSGRQVFVSSTCGGCHGSPSWTISRRFYLPSESNNGAPGALRVDRYNNLPPPWSALNPPAQMGGGSATRRARAGAGDDQINCVLRDVGTFPAALDAMQQGATGYNPPALVGLVTGAPYFHAGNARTLEEAFRATFAGHANVFAANLVPSGDAGPPPVQVRQLIAFLRSIDDRTDPVATQSSGGVELDICPPSP